MNEHGDKIPTTHVTPVTDSPMPDSPAADTWPGLDLPAQDTQPVSAGASATAALPAYPTLPAAYTREDDSPSAVQAPAVQGPAVQAPAVQAPAVQAPERIRRLLRVRTVTFGLVMLAISVISLVALLTDVRIDGGVVGLGLLIGAGAALVAGGIAAAAREARGGPGAVH